MPLRCKIYASPSARRACDHIDSLYDLFLKAFKKRMNVELFFFSEGDLKRPTYGITAYYEDNAEQRDEVKWILDNIEP